MPSQQNNTRRIAHEYRDRPYEFRRYRWWYDEFILRRWKMWLAEPTQAMIDGFFRTRAEREELRFTEERQKKEMRRLQKKNLPVRPQKTK